MSYEGELETTVPRDRDVGGSRPRTRLRLLAASQPSESPRELCCLKPTRDGRVIVGRAPGPGGVLLQDPALSRRHLEISWKGTKTLWIRDLGSKNGTFVNGARVPTDGTIEVDTERQVVISAGETLLVVERDDIARNGIGEENLPDVLFRLRGISAAMCKVRYEIKSVARTPHPVLITGETGTGKELAARAIHGSSDRKRNEFVPVNCSAVRDSMFESELFGHTKGAFTGADAERKGLFSKADKGTLFLDEIAEMPPSLQAKLLRAVEYKEIRKVGSDKAVKVDVRIVAATNKDIDDEDEFRKDLLYRLGAHRIIMPPLRERRADIPLLANQFAGEFQRKQRKDSDYPLVDIDALELLALFDWPGNVRELRNVVQDALVSSEYGTIEPEHLPRRIRDKARVSSKPAKGSGAIKKPTRQELEQLFEQHGKAAAVARHLGVTRETVQRWKKKFGLTKPRG